MYGAGRKPSTELMLMILPERCARMCGNAACVVRKMPNTLVSNSACASAIDVSSVAPSSVTPALLTSTSMRWPVLMMVSIPC